jgi:hypothetical protein
MAGYIVKDFVLIQSVSLDEKLGVIAVFEHGSGSFDGIVVDIIKDAGGKINCFGTPRLREKRMADRIKNT